MIAVLSVLSLSPAAIWGFCLWPLLTLASLGSGHIALARMWKIPTFEHEKFMAIIGLVISYLAAGGFISLLIWLAAVLH